MKQIKVAEATPHQLNWLVAKCEKANHAMLCGAGPSQYVAYIPKRTQYFRYDPCNNWSQGGPIIDRLVGFEFKQWLESPPESRCEAHIHNYDGDWIAFGPTPLIAAMRCYVDSELGAVVEVPEELA